MTELLIELKRALASKESLESLEEQAGAYERLLRVFTREVRRLTEGVPGSADEFASVWQRCVRFVAEGQTEKVQASRDELSAALAERLDVLKRLHRLAALGHGLVGQEAADPEVLLREIAALERLKSRVFDRWRTVEDLEDLAARDYPLTTADLDRIGPGQPPPASWYAEESQPF
jgi:hypothetical protein